MACAPYPVGLRIGNVSLPNSKVARGVELAVGEPPQMFALMPAVSQNNTIFYGTDGFCLSGSPNAGDWTDSACTTFRGGAYNPLASTSRTPASNSMFANDSQMVQLNKVADTVRLTDNVTLTGFPLGVALSNRGDQSDEYSPQADIGLGPDSSLLAALRKTSQIASRSWAFFLGSDSSRPTTAQLNGSLVLGGYDRAKVLGSGYTQPLTSAGGVCSSQMAVNITDIVLNFPNSTTASIFPDSSTVMQACLEPALASLFRLPLDPYFGNMMALTDNNIRDLDRSQGVYYWNMRYPVDAGEPYAGALTITFQDGPSIRIPNEQLVMPHVYIDQTTGDLAANATEPDLLIDSLQDVEKGDMPVLGRQLFAAAYLLVNQDAGHFTLWEANPTTTEDLVAVDTAGNVVTNFCADTNSTASPTPSSSFTSAPAASNDHSKAGLAAGSLAGVVVAVVAAVAALAGLVLWFFRRRRRLQQIRNVPLMQTENASNTPPVVPVKSASDFVLPQEMPSYELHPVSVVPHYEMPG